MMRYLLLFLLTAFACVATKAQEKVRTRTLFNQDWKFYLGDAAEAKTAGYDDAKWRSLNLPHDWSIELPFDSASPTGTSGGALRGGVGWYRKTFTLPVAKGKRVFISFDGVYRNSAVWVNGHWLGMRPNGYISFQYDITPYVKTGNEKNVVAVRVDNSQQPNSRWYSGSGIYRNVWLETTGDVRVDHWGTFVTTPQVAAQSAKVNITTRLKNESGSRKAVTVTTVLYNQAGKAVAKQTIAQPALEDLAVVEQQLTVARPEMWSDTRPYLYKAVTTVSSGGRVLDEYETPFGIRSFRFDVAKGFLLNGQPVKIRGVCNHHDLGCLGTAVHYRAVQRQLEILKAMGCNGIRTSHNPPAPELLELCDKMGFIVMDEAFDMWKREKRKYDYHLDFDQWHKKDLEDQVLRDRNHPCVFIWSLGNEIQEQWGNKDDTSGKEIIADLHHILYALDTTRPTVTANNETNVWNKLLQANVTELIGYNYNQQVWPKDSVAKRWGSKPLIITESVSALETRGHYDTHVPSDSIRRWPKSWDRNCENCNDDLTVSAYDNVSAPWGSTHEETLKVFEKEANVSGQFIWTGFDYIGEPTPYPWPARSSYFGIVDLAGFPKDVYYLYQSVWTDKPVLHLLPHWNWKTGSTIDVWAYYSGADEVELFLNGQSLGTRQKQGNDLHILWRVPYQPGTLQAVSRKAGKVVLTTERKTAGKPARIVLTADRSNLQAGGEDLSFITATITDADGNIVPDADNPIRFTTTGPGKVIATNNGLQTSMESFTGTTHKAFNGLCLAVVQTAAAKGAVTVTATADGLAAGTVTVWVK